MSTMDSVPLVLPTAFAVACRGCGRTRIVAVDAGFGSTSVAWREDGAVAIRSRCGCGTAEVIVRATTILERINPSPRREMRGIPQR